MKTKLALTFLLVAVIFTLATTASAQYQYKETSLYNFTSKNDGETPNNDLVMDQNGNLYGETLYGGTGGCGGKGCGSVFELSPNGSGGWTKTTLFSFGGTTGVNPIGNLLIDANGNIFGTTFEGANNTNGEVFELSPSSSGTWTLTILYLFSDPSTGINPTGLTFDGKGNIFGTAEGGGANSFGDIYELSPDGSGGWTQTVIYSFTNGNDGASPAGNLVIDAAGNLYGAARFGGSTACTNGYGCGTIFRLTPSSSGWLFSRLYDFQGPGGAYPFGPLVLDAAGNLYGSAGSGGKGYGVCFKLTPKSVGGWTETLLHVFTNGADGETPSPLIQDAAGNLYGGSNVVEFRIKPGANGSVFSILSTATGSGVSWIDASGNLYATTPLGTHGWGGVFELSPPSSSVEK